MSNEKVPFPNIITHPNYNVKCWEYCLAVLRDDLVVMQGVLYQEVVECQWNYHLQKVGHLQQDKWPGNAKFNLQNF